MRGTIKRIVPEQGGKKGGFGFIRDAQGRDRFFHKQDCCGFKFTEAAENMRVEFDAVEGSGKGNGLRATNLRRVVDEAAS